MRERGPDALYSGLHLAREVGKFLLGVAYGTVKSGLDGLGNAIGLFGRSAHRFSHGSTEAVRLSANIPEAGAHIVGVILQVIQGVACVSGPVSDRVSTGADASAHILGGVLNVLGTVHDLLQAVYRLAQAVYCVIQAKVHAKGKLPVVCHWLHPLSAKSKAAGSLAPLLAPFFVVEYAGLHRLLVLSKVHALEVGIAQAAASEDEDPHIPVSLGLSDCAVYVKLTLAERFRWP